ncbi:MAG: hypothetical protein J5643_00415 [Lachnospiraceae bacterium]|nr:hypothetical protein [Lachnospiraceae bacterium]
MKVYDEHKKLLGYLRFEDDDLKLVAGSPNLDVQMEDVPLRTDTSYLFWSRELADWFCASSAIILFGWLIFTLCGSDMPKELQFIGIRPIVFFCPVAVFLRVIITFYGGFKKNSDLVIAFLMSIIQIILITMYYLMLKSFVFTILVLIVELLQFFLVCIVMRSDIKSLNERKPKRKMTVFSTVPPKFERIVITTLVIFFVCVLVFSFIAIANNKQINTNTSGPASVVWIGYIVTVILELIVYYLFGREFRALADND